MTRPAYVRRRSPKKGVFDDFPTPPWATRAFFEYVAPELLMRRYTVKEPAAGRGHMVRVLKQLKFKVEASDIKDYGVGFRAYDYRTAAPVKRGTIDLVITNPPYNCANDFVERALKEARVGVAILARTLWLEGGKDTAPRSRWNRILRYHPPTKIAVFSARMPAAQGKVVQHRAVFTSHSWFWWDLTRGRPDCRFLWIPPEAQRLLERPEDYR